MNAYGFRKLALSTPLFVLAALLLPSLSHAQTGQGTIVGTVSDATGAEIPRRYLEACL